MIIDRGLGKYPLKAFEIDDLFGIFDIAQWADWALFLVVHICYSSHAYEWVKLDSRLDINVIAQTWNLR